MGKNIKSEHFRNNFKHYFHSYGTEIYKILVFCKHYSGKKISNEELIYFFSEDSFYYEEKVFFSNFYIFAILRESLNINGKNIKKCWVFKIAIHYILEKNKIKETFLKENLRII